MIYLQNADRLFKKLSQLSGKELLSALRRPVRDGAKVVQAEAKNIAPVRSGRYKSAIKVRQKSNKKGVTAQVKVDNKDAPHGSFLEYPIKHIPNPPRPLKHAADNAKDAAFRTVEDGILEQIRKITNGT